MAKRKRKPLSEKDESTGSPIDFERALADVESIVGKLESGELGLTESLQQYEIGIKRLKQCHALLQKAERRVTLLSGIDDDGNPIVESFEMEGSDSTDSSPLRKKKPLPGAGAGSQDSVDDLPGLF